MIARPNLTFVSTFVLNVTHDINIKLEGKPKYLIEFFTSI